MFRTVRRVRRAGSRAVVILLLIGLIASPGPTKALFIGYVRWEAAWVEGVIAQALKPMIRHAERLQHSQRHAAHVGTTRR
jgi:hypothetical protein